MYDADAAEELLNKGRDTRHRTRCLAREENGGKGGRATAAYRKRDSHLALRDGVHGRAHERRLEHDVARDAALRADLLRREVDLAGQEEEVVVRESAVHARVHQVGDGEPVRAFVALQDLDGVRGVEEGVGVGGHGGGVGERLPDSAFFVPEHFKQISGGASFYGANVRPPTVTPTGVNHSPKPHAGVRAYKYFSVFTSWPAPERKADMGKGQDHILA